MRLSVVVGLGLSCALLSGCNDAKLANSSSDIEVSPSEVLFEQTVPGATNTKTVTVTNRGGSSLTVDGLELGGATPALFDAAAETGFPLTLGPQEWVAIQVTYAPAETGEHGGVLTVFSSDAGTPTVDVPLLTSPIAGEIEASPNPLQFGSVTIGSPSTQAITVTNAGAADLAVSGAQLGAGTSSWFTLDASALPVTLAPGSSAQLPVTFAPESSAAVTGTVEIASDDPDEPVVAIALGGAGTAEAVPDIQAATTLDFGQVERLTCETMTASIQNTGSATLSVTGITKTFYTSTEYTFSPASFSVPPGGSQPLSVTYCPVDTGFDLGGLNVASNDPDENPFSIALAGEGIPPPVAETDISIELEWNTNGNDVDVHLVRPGGTYDQAPGDCFWNNLSPDWGVAGDASDDPYLDYDDIDGYGPENLNYAKPQTGTYRVIVDYFSEFGSATATITVWLDGGATPVYVGSQSMNGTNRQKWVVGDITWDAPSDSGTWATVNTIGPDSSFGPAQTK